MRSLRLALLMIAGFVLLAPTSRAELGGECMRCVSCGGPINCHGAPACNGLGDICVCYVWCDPEGDPGVLCFCYRFDWPFDVELSAASTQRSLDTIVGLRMSSKKSVVKMGHVAKALNDLSGWKIKVQKGGHVTFPTIDIEHVPLRTLIMNVAALGGVSVDIDEAKTTITFRGL